MIGMFDKKNANPEIIRNLKNKITQKLNLPENTMLSIAELNCHKPDCPPYETIITVHAVDESVINWRIAKPINEIKDIDLANLDINKNKQF